MANSPSAPETIKTRMKRSKSKLEQVDLFPQPEQTMVHFLQISDIEYYSILLSPTPSVLSTYY